MFWHSLSIHIVDHSLTSNLKHMAFIHFFQFCYMVWSDMQCKLSKSNMKQLVKCCRALQIQFSSRCLVINGIEEYVKKQTTFLLSTGSYKCGLLFGICFNFSEQCISTIVSSSQVLLYDCLVLSNQSPVQRASLKSVYIYCLSVKKTVGSLTHYFL